MKEGREMTATDPIYIKVQRPEGYDDICDDLVLADLDIHGAFRAELVTAELRRLRISQLRRMRECALDRRGFAICYLSIRDAKRWDKLIDAIDAEIERLRGGRGDELA